MHGKILVIDPISTNRIVLKVKLSTAHYSVVQAGSISDALTAIKRTVPDVILTAQELPDGDATSLIERVRKSRQMRDVPMIAFQNEGSNAARLDLLAAGFDDVIAKPFDDVLLLARVRSLVRVCNSAAEWKLRDDTSRALGLAEAPTAFEHAARATIMSSNTTIAKVWTHQLSSLVGITLDMAKPQNGLGPTCDTANGKEPDVFILDMGRENAPEMLRMLAEIRSHSRTRHSGVLVVQSNKDADLASQALDLGASDIMTEGFAAQEMALRIQTLVKRKHIADRLRATVRTGLEAAVCDPLTGLHNRRYAMPHLARIAENAQRSGKPFAVMVADMDYFKHINDVYGHATGDVVLVETAQRLRENLRAVDLVARIGGEEFLVVMPGVGLRNARLAATRLCELIGCAPFQQPDGSGPLTATISIGLAIGDASTFERYGAGNVAAGLLDQADKALYHAKELGRNQVRLSRPAA
ncbi:Response regulator PleD [Ascidiaceihabitans donghaensis]|uniref:diguanylate cyclase n=1 Tax=Ascidiaceihabitans donghaensis TaxID=1510460 RepID=A0A2R8BGU7_9RHOB|nr:diguanylate cyclase [Ascidiaceihabitans donghaensis]SPH22290.1 Response regulator PleD [Ascidiaceihabitans donghaensis]